MADSQARIAATQEAELAMAKEVHQSSLLGVDRATTDMNAFRKSVRDWSAFKITFWLKFIGCSNATVVLMGAHLSGGTSLCLLGQTCVRGFAASESTINAMQTKYSIRLEEAEKIFLSLCHFQDDIAEFERLPLPAEVSI
jgi:hypothetical protein